MTPLPHKLALTVSGTVRLDLDPLTHPSGLYVYQRVHKKYGNIQTTLTHGLQLRRHVKTPNTRTPAQLARRSAFAAALLAWRALTPAEKTQWSATGKPRALPGYQCFLSAYLKSH